MYLYKSLEGKSLKSSEGDFIIKTDDIKRIKQGEYISYTMVLEKRNPKNSTIYNLTIENKAGIPGMFITAYKPSPQWLADKTKTFDGEINTYRTDVITHIPENEEPPESGDGGTSGGGGGQGDGTAYPYDCEGEVVSSRVAVPYSCGCGHLPGQGCQGCDRESPYLPGYEYIDVYECYNSSTGENGGSTDQPSGGSGDDSTDNTSNDLHSLTILMDDGSRVTTAEYLTNMWSLNYSESQKLKEEPTFSDRLYFYMQNNQFSRQAMVFGNEAFDAFMNGGEVDFEEQIINNLSGKALNVYNKLKSTSTGFKNNIKKFEPEFSVSHLKFNLADIGTSRGRAIAPNSNPRTPDSPNFVITIEINNNSTDSGVDNRPELLVAKTIAHEVIHAEMYRKLLSVLDNGGTITGVTRQDVIDALDGNFPGMYDYFRRHKNWQHQQMATHYRESLARILQEFDTGIAVANNQQPAQLYKDLAWEGLRYPNIYTWTSLPQTERDRINQVISNYIANNLD